MSNTTAAKPSVSNTVLERLKSLDDLPHFPNALAKLEKLLSQQDLPDIAEISQIIIQDPRLTAGLIGVANTAKYTNGSKVTDLSDAISRIGLKDIRTMAHAINYKSAFKTKPPFSEKQFLKHALLAAFVAQDLAKSVHLNPGEAFLAGLMKDIGIYLLAIESREKYQQVMELASGGVSALLPAESQLFSTTHPVLSARLLKQWKFSNDVVMGVAGHHAPEKAHEAFQAYAYLIFLSEYAALKLGVDNGVVSLSEESDVPEEVLMALDYFGLAAEVFDDLIERTYMNFESTGMV